MSQEKLRELLVRFGCLHLPPPDGVPNYHFIDHGLHWEGMCSIRPLAAHVAAFWWVTEALAEIVSARSMAKGVQTVVALESDPGPVFSMVLASELARLERNPHIKVVNAHSRQRAPHGLTVPDDLQKHIAGKQVLIAHSSIHISGIVRRLVMTVRALGGEVTGVATIATNRQVSLGDMDVPALARLLNFDVRAYQAQHCAKVGPCAINTPIVTNVLLGGNNRAAISHPGAKIHLELP